MDQRFGSDHSLPDLFYVGIADVSGFTAEMATRLNKLVHASSAQRAVWAAHATPE